MLTVDENGFQTFGQTFIHDDFFLAMVSSLSSVCNALSRVVWGSIADRLSYQVSMSIVTTVGACLMWSLLLTQYLGKAGFLLWVCHSQLVMSIFHFQHGNPVTSAT